MKFNIAFTLLVLMSLGVPSSVYGQDRPTFSPSEDANVIESKILKEVKERLEREPGPAEVDEQERVITEDESEVRFSVRNIHLDGNDIIPTEELRPLLELYEGKETTLAGLKHLAEGIQQEYRHRGYITTFVFIPPQRIEDGQVQIKVIEGKVGDIRVEGNRYFRKKLILAYSEIEKGEVLQYSELRKYLYDLNQNPDREARAILRPGKESGTTDIIVNIKDHFPLHVGFTMDNQGVKTSGDERFGFTLRDNNLFSFDDILLGGVVFGQNFGAVFTQYLLPIPAIQTKLIAGFSHAQVSPKEGLKPFSVNGTSETYFFRFEKALWDTTIGSVGFSFGLNAGYEFKESRTKVLSGTFQRSRLRIARVGATIREEDRFGITNMSHEFAFGIDWMGAAVFVDPAASRQGVEPQFFRYRSSTTRNQRMPFGTRARIHFEFQIPSHKLPSQEAFYLGGANTIRGYPEGDYLGDAGYLLNVEYFVPSFFFPKHWKLPFSDQNMRNQLQWVAFFDHGYGILRGPTARETYQRYLTGVGGGLRIGLFKNLFGRVEWAIGIGDHPQTEDRRSQFHFRLQLDV